VLELRINAPRPHIAKRSGFERGAIVHLDASVVVVDKPPGVSTVPFEGEEDPRETLDAWVRDVLSKKGGSRGRAPLGVVHRIDKETSGLVVFTRSVAAKQHLANQFRHHTTLRRYLAIVHGAFTTKRTFESYLVENRGDGLRGSARPGQREGRLAVTHVEPVRQLEGATLVGCTLETGRTHQIRIHLSEAGHPLVGERVYVRNYTGLRIDAPRLMLHAAMLGFVHPATEETIQLESEPPADFREVLARLERPGVTPR
jgi:23S rRNA pseudouridine1911/1915/1917 synthase